jgi:hypothetical protein
MIGPEWAKELREVQRIADNHVVMVNLLYDLASYSHYLWQQNTYARTRSISKGMQDRIHRAFERLELKQ